MRNLLFLPFALLAAVAACATPMAIAAEDAAAPQSPIENCLVLATDDLDAQRACIGRVATWCVENTPGGETTVGIIQCVHSEQMQWENVRAAEVAKMRAQETPSQVALLNQAITEQARWTEARCAYEASIYEGGSLSRVIAAQCLRNAAAEHALYLRNRYSED